jgi:hypothetical protein
VVSSPTVLLLFPLTLNSSLAVASSPPGSALPRPPQGEEEGESGHHRAHGADGSPGEGPGDARLPIPISRRCAFGYVASGY